MEVWMKIPDVHILVYFKWEGGGGGGLRQPYNVHVVFSFIPQYLHSPTFSLDELILDRRGSYIDKQHSFTRRHA